MSFVLVPFGEFPPQCFNRMCIWRCSTVGEKKSPPVSKLAVISAQLMVCIMSLATARGPTVLDTVGPTFLSMMSQGNNLIRKIS